jgi:hypothetical protein
LLGKVIAIGIYAPLFGDFLLRGEETAGLLLDREDVEFIVAVVVTYLLEVGYLNPFYVQFLLRIGENLAIALGDLFWLEETIIVGIF